MVEEAPVGVEAEESTTTETVPAEEPPGEGATPVGEEDGFWDGPWPWILGGAVVVGGGVGIAVAASGGGGGGGGGDDGDVTFTCGPYNVTVYRSTKILRVHNLWTNGDPFDLELPPEGIWRLSYKSRGSENHTVEIWNYDNHEYKLRIDSTYSSSFTF